MQSHKIVYVITKANWGGAQHYVYDLALAARAAGDDVAVVTAPNGELVDRLKAANVRTIAIPIGQSRSAVLDLLTFGSLFSLIRVFRAERPQVVHVNSAKAGGLGAVAARIARVPRIIFTAHGWAWNESRPVFERCTIRFFSWLTVLLSHRTICVSEAIARDARWMLFVQKNFSVIRLGIACGEILPRAEARAALASTTLSAYTWIGMVSELHPTKRVEDAIRAFARIEKEFPGAALVVLGEGSERTKLESLAHALGCAERVVLAGFVANAPAHLSAFDFFVHASQSEALGYAILEAGCASLPVVATRVGGIPEIIEDGVTGVLVPPRSPEKLADALRALMRDPARAATFGAALRQKVLADFSKQKMLASTLTLY